tara:strand:- start:798 stop:1124 length:327 start_codon:yes stop_codon:yes gene_type:complete
MPKFKKNTSTFKMYGKSPMARKLVGKQKNLPEHLKAKIEAAPPLQMRKTKSLPGIDEKSYTKSTPMMKYKSDAQRKAVHASKAEKGSMAKKYGKKSMAKNYKKGYYGA